MSSFYYNLLNNSEKSLYNSIYSALTSGSNIVPSSPAILTASDIGRVIEYVKNDHPELSFDMPLKYNRALQKLIFHSKVEYIGASHADRAFLESFRRAAIASCGGEYEKVRYVHDFVVNSVEYDYEFLRTKIVDPSNHSAKGALDTGKAVCEGIARLTQLLLEQIGVDAIYCEGKTKEAIRKGDKICHAWNAVRIDGVYYFLDVSHDICKTTSRADKCYRYFCLPYDEITSDRVFHLEKEFASLGASSYKYCKCRRKREVLSSSEELREWAKNSLLEAISRGDEELTLQFEVSSRMLSDRGNAWEALCMSALYRATDSINERAHRTAVTLASTEKFHPDGRMTAEFILK